MKLYEKIALILVAVTFLLQCLLGDGLSTHFLVTVLGLAFSYLFAGFWLFNVNE